MTPKPFDVLGLIDACDVSELTQTQQRVVQQIARRADATGYAYPGLSFLMGRTDRGRTSVSDAIRELVELGWLTPTRPTPAQRARGVRNGYTVHVPPKVAGVLAALRTKEAEIAEARSRRRGLPVQAEQCRPTGTAEDVEVTAEQCRPTGTGDHGSGAGAPASSAGPPDPMLLSEIDSIEPINARELPADSAHATRLDDLDVDRLPAELANVVRRHLPGRVLKPPASASANGEPRELAQLATAIEHHLPWPDTERARDHARAQALQLARWAMGHVGVAVVVGAVRDARSRRAELGAGGRALVELVDAGAAAAAKAPGSMDRRSHAAWACIDAKRAALEQARAGAAE